MASDLVITPLEHRAQLVELEDEWNRLLDRTDVGSPFLTPSWQLAWLDTYGASRRPYVLTARRGGEFIGLWPLASRNRGLFRVLEPIGAGPSDWLDVPVLIGDRDATLAAFCRFLAEQRARWDLIDMRNVLAESPTIPVLAACIGDGPLRMRGCARTIAPYLAIQGTWEGYLATRSANFRSSLRRRIRRARATTGGLTAARLECSDPGEIVRVLAHIEQKSWKAREGTRKLTTATGREFYLRFLTAFAARNLLQIWTAEMQGTMVAYLVLFVHRRKCYYYNGAYAEEASDLSPGTLLHAAAIENAFRMGLQEYDFLSGDEPYKNRWCTQSREIHHLALFNERPGSVAAFAALVSARWTLRSSRSLRQTRSWLIAASRRLFRAESDRNNGG